MNIDDPNWLEHVAAENAKMEDWYAFLPNGVRITGTQEQIKALLNDWRKHHGKQGK